jgi:putative transposase
MPDHVHMLLSIPPKMSISSFMGYLKGKSALMIFDTKEIIKYPNYIKKRTQINLEE